ncbi:MAG TPA: MG2 domain-containing protein, partial [Vicinamibacterales bacterium]
MSPRIFLCLLLIVCAARPQAAPQSETRPPLRVVSAGPTDEVAAIEEANEVRVVFSEPMVSLGRIPAKLQPAFFHISPAVAGTFRWSGTTILIFTPSQRFPLGTTYDVTIDATAAAFSGRKLPEPYKFTFTTPTVRLLQTNWYRPAGRYDRAPIVVLRFNQPVSAEDVAAHVSAHFQNHPFDAPGISPAVQARIASINPGSMQAFDAKVKVARAAASATGPVAMTLTDDWDKKRFPVKNDMAAFELTTPVPPDSWVKLDVDGRIKSLAGPALSGKRQDFTVQVERTFLIDGFECSVSCDPDRFNGIMMRVPVKTAAFAGAIGAIDVTTSANDRAVAKTAPKQRASWRGDEGTVLSLEDGGVQAQPPATTWLATVSADLQAADGQTLGYTWAGTVENWHRLAFTSFGDGHGVWETGGGSLLPFYSRNFVNVRQWAAPVEPTQLMQTVRDLREADFHKAPSTAPVERRLGVTADKILSHGLDISNVLKPSGTGLIWTAVQEGQPIDRAHMWKDANHEPMVRASLVQVTNLGISVKDSLVNTLIFVTRLDTAAPVPGARVSIVQQDGRALWTGTTGADGVAIAPQARLRNPRKLWELAFLVTAEKDGDVAYVASDWNEGIRSWDFGLPYSADESEPLLRGSVFTDRGVYRLGEEVHFKAVLRYNAPTGVALLPASTEVILTTRDSRNHVVDERTVKVNGWSSAEWTLTLPADGSLGDYAVRAILPADRPKDAPRTPNPDEEDQYLDDGVPWNKAIHGSFLVAAYRKPDFRVDVSLAGTPSIAGEPLKGVVKGRYLFGAPMPKRPTHWTLTRAPLYSAPDTIDKNYPDDRWTFVGWSENEGRRPDVAANDGQLGANGELPLVLQTDAKAGLPYSYTLEGDVEDVSRQHIANRASAVVHPAPWYIGIKRIPMFNQQSAGVKTEIVAVGLDGTPVPGVAIDVKLTQVQWLSVRRAEGNGFYSWDTERKDVPSGEWHLTSGADPMPLDIPLPAGGFFILEARANADAGRYTMTRSSFYSLGAGYTAWQRYDHNRIDLVAERTAYKPGETARIMIQSPWEQATALVTTEREGIRSHRQFALTSTQQSIDIPISDKDIPNLFVSVLLVKGRSKAAGESKKEGQDGQKEDDPADPGKPSFRLGYVQLKVEDQSKRLTMTVTANKEEYRPANAASVTMNVKDPQGRGVRSEVTLWAVDYGVLSLTGYRTPDVLGSVYVQKALGITNEDNRQRIISRRVLTPKGSTDGGGGGDDSGPGMVRRDFRTLAFWLGSVATDDNGHASVDVKLPESLTTYRIMAVAADRDSRFGSADAEIRINKPVTLKATFPRFLAVGDKATFGAVVTSQLKEGGPATITIASLDPAVMAFADTTPRTVDVA